ncbi:MAG: phosphatidate cytidylyltransferase [Bacteroidota bacterium]
MIADLFSIILLGAGFLTIFGIGEILYHFFNVKAEYTRKLSHVATGLLTLLFPIYLSSHWSVLLLCSSFAVLLLSSLKFNFLKSINAVDRLTWGSLLYPAIVYICYIIYSFHNNLIFFYLPILIMAKSDPIAALVGKRFPYGKFKIFNDNKTLSGSLAFFISAIIISIVLFNMLTAFSIATILCLSTIIALATAITEAISSKGFDNLTIPLTAVCILIIYFEFFIY